MNNLSLYCGLVDAKIRASDKDLPVSCSPDPTKNFEFCFHEFSCIFGLSEKANKRTSFFKWLKNWENEIQNS